MYYTHSSNTVQTREENVYFSKSTQYTGSCKNKAQQSFAIVVVVYNIIHVLCLTDCTTLELLKSVT